MKVGVNIERELEREREQVSASFYELRAHSMTLQSSAFGFHLYAHIPRSGPPIESQGKLSSLADSAFQMVVSHAATRRLPRPMPRSPSLDLKGEEREGRWVRVIARVASDGLHPAKDI